jgi:hypothetical protein
MQQNNNKRSGLEAGTIPRAGTALNSYKPAIFPTPTCPESFPCAG